MERQTQERTINHFSHPHPLHLFFPTQNSSLTPISCAACTTPISSSWTYSCPPCRYHIHFSCSQHPPLIHHPSHPPHPLALLSTPAYSNGRFKCDACSFNGTGFSYHCPTCRLDLHTSCASMPLSISHRAHSHPLTLAFSPPYESKGFICDVCDNLGRNHWLYRCAMCKFDVHLGCATPAREGGGQVTSTVSQLAMGSASAPDRTMIGRVFSGILEGVVQQFGQTIMHGIMGDGENGVGSWILDVAGGILGSAFEGFADG